MRLFGIRYIWFKLALVAGSLLGIILLVQSIQTYLQVSRGLVIAELRREAQRQIALVQREAMRQGIRDPAELGPVLEEIQQDAPNRIAWIRILHPNGNVLAQVGQPVGPPLKVEFQPGFEEMPLPPGEIRETDQGRVWVTAQLLGLGLGRRAFPPLVSRQGPPPPSPPERGDMRPPMPRPGPRTIEIALYMSGVSAVFGPLITNLVINSSAALGLVASMVLLWLRFPNYINGKRLEEQTQLARKVQMDLLPPPDLEIAGIDFAAKCIPAQQVGGDFYDVYSAPDGRIAISVGDVSGKGLPAAMVVGLLLGAIRAGSWMASKEEHEAATARLSELIRTRTGVERFVSLFWCYFDPASQTLYYVNAGHLPPMLVGRDEHGNPRIQRLEVGGPVLGVLPDAEYEQGEAVLRPGDLLVMYSDGVVEATNAFGAQFEEEGLLKALLANLEKPASEIRDAVIQEVHRFLDKERPQDDLTLVVARFERPPQKATAA